MKSIFCLFLASGLAVGLAPRPALAQTTNGINTGAERQAQSDAYTRSEAARRASAPAPASPGANTPLYSGSGRPQTLTEKEAEMNALFGFETAAQKAAARRAVAQRERDKQAAALRDEETRKAAAAVERAEYAKDEDRRITSMVPWDKVGFNISDCQELGSLSTNYNPTVEMVQVLGNARAARPAFVALYAQPTATYEALRAVAQQLPQRVGEYLYGINTATKQYDQLYERFPARRATAAADLAQALVTYFGWYRGFDKGFETDDHRLDKIKLLQKAAAANPAAGHLAGLRLALDLNPKGRYKVHVLSKSDGVGTSGVIHGEYYNMKFMDTAMVGQLGRFAYAGGQHYLRTGQAAALGLTPDDVRRATGARAFELAELELVQGRPAAARAWLRRALETDPASETLQQGTVNYLRVILYEYPKTFGALQPAEWQLLQKPMGLTEPLRVKPVQAWLADTVRLPDDPRWQTLTDLDRADLRQACTVAEWLTQGQLLLHYKSQFNAKRATWNYVLAAGPGPNLEKAENLWREMARGGDVGATRNLYRAHLLGDKLPPLKEAELVDVVNLLSNTDGYIGHGKNQYKAALMLLDELPGYPPLGKSFRKSGRKMVESAAYNGDSDAKERLKRGF